jgi:hypothetical protein
MIMVFGDCHLDATNPAPLLLADGRTAARSEKFSRNFLVACERKFANTRHIPIMAGIKRKSEVSKPTDTKSKSKKAKVEKSSSKSESKHAVKPVKKSKKAKAESEDELEESDTSEQENGFYGFSAKEDVEMSDADSSEEAEPMEDVKQNGKAHKRKSDDNDGEEKKKPNNGAADSKLAEMNGECLRPLVLQRLIGM